MIPMMVSPEMTKIRNREAFSILSSEEDPEARPETILKAIRTARMPERAEASPGSSISMSSVLILPSALLKARSTASSAVTKR